MGHFGPLGPPGGRLWTQAEPKWPIEPQKEPTRSKKEPQLGPISEPIWVVLAFSFHYFFWNPLGSLKIPEWAHVAQMQ